MSMHKIPLTEVERDGLKKHGLSIDKPSQLSDAFRQGVAHGAAQSTSAEMDVLKAKNKQLQEALLSVARKAEMLKQECGDSPESPQAIRNGRYMHISYVAHAAIKGGA